MEGVDGAPIGRRVFLGMLGLGVAGIAFGGSAQQALNQVLPSTELLPASGGFRYYSVVGYDPHRSDTEYRLRVTGLVDRPLELTLADLKAMAPTSLTRDFQCVTGWRVPDVPWTGVKLADLLDAAGVRAEAKAVTFRCFDGAYTESLTLEQARLDDVLAAYEMEGGPVTRAHGGPVRLYVAPMYGYKSAKWLSEIELVDRVEPGYWEVRGYDIDAWVGRSNGRDDAPV